MSQNHEPRLKYTRTRTYTLLRSRLHWALLERYDVMEMWDTGHLPKDDGVEGPTATCEAVQEGIPLSLMSSRARTLLGVGREVKCRLMHALYASSNFEQIASAELTASLLGSIYFYCWQRYSMLPSYTHQVFLCRRTTAVNVWRLSVDDIFVIT